MTVVRVARPKILDELDPEKHAVIEASAGTGKTYTLEHLIVELVLAKVPIESILVVTFTDKATREMRERVRNKLRATLDARGDDGPEGTWTIDEDARRRLSDALAVFDRAPISTIHAFCQRVLTESAFECARLLRQEQVESREAFLQAFRDELRIELAEGAPLRPILERAIAIHRLERVEESLYRWYLERAEPTPRFDRELAHAALLRLPTRMELAPSGVASRLLGQALRHPSPKKEVPRLLMELAKTVETLRAGGPFYAALLSFWDWAALPAPGNKKALSYLREHLRKAAERTASLRPLAESIDQLARVASSPLHVLITELLPRVALRLSNRKREEGHFDFDDMLRMLDEALHADGSEALVSELRRRYQVALVDEFQDTDRVQWSIFKRLFVEGTSEHRLIVIGDPKQAIYGFRNADVHTYHAAVDELKARGASMVALTVSYRSRAPLVEAVNRILERGFFSGVNAYPNPVTCGRPELDVRDPSGNPLPAITLFHFVGRPELRADRVRAALGTRIASEIERLLQPPITIVDARGPRPLTPSDIHVLCRSRSDAEHVGAALREARIPHAFYKQEGLFQTSAARDVYVVLRAIENPDARVRRLDAWLTPFFAVPLERLDECRDLPPEHPLVARLERWRALAEAEEWPALFRAMLEESGLIRRELFIGGSERRLTDYQHIVEVLLEEVHRGRRSLPEILARLAAFIEGRELPAAESGNVHRLESERKAVQILTMHKSKGLEAEVVFLAGGLSEPAADPLSPRIFHDEKGERVAWIGEPVGEVRERLRREQIEEAERLLYVAITRARSCLYLPYFGPPPPGAPLDARAAYELSTDPEPAPPSAPRPQLDLLFADPSLPAAPDDAPSQYELSRLSGPYRQLNERLVELVQSGVVTREPALFERVEVPVTPRRGESFEAQVAISGFQPPPALLSSDVAEDTERFARLARRHRGPEITSYTRMKNALGGYAAPEPADPREEEVDAALPPESDKELSGGASVGVFLHEVLEHLPFERVREVESGRELLADEAISKLFSRHALENGIDRELIGIAADLLVRALKTPLVLADATLLPEGLCSASRRVTELSYLHPIPERSHPTLAEPPAGPLSIDRGYVRGVIDLLFEHEGRWHVVDYKSDRLPSYAPEMLSAHVERNYLVQARLYTLGTLRALAIHDAETYERRFGGLLYAFLRGMGEGEGVWTLRPSWEEVLEWERALLSDTPWGHALPARRA